MSEQTTIDVRPPDLATAVAVGQVASQLATDRAERENPGFSDLAKAAILRKLFEGPASGEDLTDYVAACGIHFKDGRALGGIVGSLSRRKLITVVGDCHRRRGHGTAGGLIWSLSHSYEAHKAAWLAANPGATSEQIECECRRLAEVWGV